MSKNVRLSEAAYERLEAHKRPDESFSDVVLRLAGERSLLDLAGVLTDRQADALEAAIDERRRRRREALDARAEELG